MIKIAFHIFYLLNAAIIIVSLFPFQFFYFAVALDVLFLSHVLIFLFPVRVFSPLFPLLISTYPILNS